MESRLTTRLKPAAPAKIHLAMAASLWSVVGIGLGLAGWHWVHAGHLPARSWLIAATLATGVMKGLFVLHRSADAIVTRIQSRGDGKCLGGFLSPRTWVFVLSMMAMGRILRKWVLPLPWAGLLYLWVGTALVVGSWFIWRAIAPTARHLLPSRD